MQPLWSCDCTEQSPTHRHPYMYRYHAPDVNNRFLQAHNRYESKATNNVYLI